MYFLFFRGGAQIFLNWPLNFITVVAIARLLCSRFVRDIILCDVVCALAKYRYSSNMRESSSESDDVELESNYSSSENDDNIKGCYMNEPEYLEKEINAMNILENENFSDNSEESDLDSSRLENLHWCSGFECGIALTMREGTRI